MIKRSFLLFLLFHLSSPAKHSLKYFLTSSTGISDFPQLVAVLVVDDLQASYCYSDKGLDVQHDAWNKLFDEHKLREQITEQCSRVLPTLYRTRLHNVMKHFNQSGGVHALQVIRGCEWDDKTGETSGFMKCGYDGDDFMELDLKTKTWISQTPQAVAIKQQWDADKPLNQERVEFITHIYPQWLKTYLSYNNSLTKPVPHSVSLLQKSPSSPVSCHATGFYPNRTEMFWRKDGEEIHEDVDRGEILPNLDGTFQMRVDLNVSSVKDEDWSRYDCVVQFSGVENNTIIMRLDKAAIRTNWGSAPEFSVRAVIKGVVGFLFLAVCTGLIICRKCEQKK